MSYTKIVCKYQLFFIRSFSNDELHGSEDEAIIDIFCLRISSFKSSIIFSLLRTTGLALSFSTAEYGCAIWGRSGHAKQVDAALNETCRLITGCLRPTKMERLYLASSIAPSQVRRTVSDCERSRMKMTPGTQWLDKHWK